MGGASLLTLSSGAEAVETDASVRLIEASMEFDLPDANYISDRPHGNPIYTVDTERDVIAVYPTRSNAANRIRSGGQVVGTQSVVNPPTRVGPTREKYVVTDVLGYRRPTEIVYTDAVPPVVNPRITTAGETAVVDTDQIAVAPDESVELDQPDVELTVYERFRSDSRIRSVGCVAENHYRRGCRVSGMNGTQFTDRVAAAKRTELDRLGSNKLLIALTDATLDADAVLQAAADSEHAASRTFAGWAGDTEPSDASDARETFEWVADRERDHRERVLAAHDAVVGSTYEPADGGALHSYLRERDGVIERAATGLVGRALVSDRTHGQLVSFFVNEQDQPRADLFRELRAETREERDRGLALLDAHCDSADDWERASMVAEYVVQVAYDEYADSLAGLGIDVKSVC